MRNREVGRKRDTENGRLMAWRVRKTDVNVNEGRLQLAVAFTLRQDAR